MRRFARASRFVRRAHLRSWSITPIRGAHVAAYEYGGRLTDAITRFKYRGDFALGPVLGALACNALPRLRDRVEIVTHVPLHEKRLAERGFDQSALLGSVVAARLSVPMVYGALQRDRNTPRQALLGRKDRLANVTAAFSASAAKGRISGHSVLLVDDVRTTGSTLSACAAVLLAMGATRVSTLVLARDV